MEANIPIARKRRRRHSAEFKALAVKACMQPGVSIASVALHYRLNANLLRTWLKAHEGCAVTGQARASVKVAMPEFIPLPLAAAHGTPPRPDIVIEIKREGAAVTIRWPHAAAAECADWLHGWLR